MGDEKCVIRKKGKGEKGEEELTILQHFSHLNYFAFSSFRVFVIQLDWTRKNNTKARKDENTKVEAVTNKNCGK